MMTRLSAGRFVNQQIRQTLVRGGVPFRWAPIKAYNINIAYFSR